jgi:hypothetical protein
VSVGGIIILTNTRTLLNAFEVSNSVRPEIYATIAAIWLVFVGLAVQGLRKDRREARIERDRERERELVPAA